MAGTSVIHAVVAALCFTGASAWPFSRRQALSLQDVQKQALENAYKVLDGTLSDGLTNRPKTCTKETVSIRKEYGDMSKDERLEYLRAVKCILKAPSKLPAAQYPGAKSRYDDFTVVHMNMSKCCSPELYARVLTVLKHPQSMLPPTSCTGTATTSGLMKQHFGTNASTKATNPTGTGANTPT
jgi:hypothetical protein